MKNVQFFRPFNPLLAPYIECYLFPTFGYDTVLKSNRGVLEVLPSPGTSIILFFSEPSFYWKDGKLERYEDFVFTGYYSTPRKILRTSSLDQMIIKFTPCGIQLLLDFQINEVIDSYVSIKEVFKEDFNALQSKLINANSNIERISIFEEFMVSKLSRAKSIDNRAWTLIDYLFQRNGHKGIKQISKELGIGERTIQRIIHKYVGINYKSFSKLIRFQEARKLLSRYNYKNKIAQLAYELNYFDQAHLIHDFKSFSNLTPNQFLDKQMDNHLFDIPNRLTYDQKINA